MTERESRAVCGALYASLGVKGGSAVRGVRVSCRGRPVHRTGVRSPCPPNRGNSIFVAWLLGLVGIIGDITALIAPAGLLLAIIGVMLFKNFRGLRDRMRKREERSLNYRLTESRSATKFGGVMMVIIGLGWFAMGTAALLGAL